MTPATARSRSRSRAHARTTVAPRRPRRVSGPIAAAAGGAALPRAASALPRLPRLPRFARHRSRSARHRSRSARHRLRLGALRALPDHRLVDRLLRSRLWIWALGLALGGIVTMQVSLLKLNSGISRAVETTTTLERQNADLEASIAQLSSPDRIESGASTLGMLMPPAGDVRYLNADSRDAALAARRMQPPSDDAAALMANRGVVPGSLAPPLETAPEAIAPATETTPTPVSTPEPAAPPPTTTSQPAPTGAAVAAQG